MPAVTPYVLVENARDFMAFLEQTFHAEFGTIVPLDTDPQRVVHGEVRIGDSTFNFSDSGADGKQCLSTPDLPAHIQLWVQIDDPASAFDRAVAAGANGVAPVTDQGDGSEFGGFIDPWRTFWWVAGTK